MTHFKIDIVSDTVCPWCYVGHRRLSKAIAQHQSQNPADTFSITWKPYYLDPTAPKVGENKLERYQRKFSGQAEALLDRMTQTGKLDGINFKWGGKTGNTRDSHRLIELGGQKGGNTQTRVVEELFAAYFENEKDITSHAVLQEAAVKAGLDEVEVKDWLSSDKGGKEVDHEVRQAQLRGISGVPNFTINQKYVVGGAQEVDAFLELFNETKE
ncbi:thioredoxin-like protein [Phyllosticta citrichinensis]|uniref:Thioredoxin-like protein n=1 Tax=Phyllosticta citrichinensis TaxID=1130410 RepID=A0ABR1XHK2_9PEZI